MIRWNKSDAPGTESSVGVSGEDFNPCEEKL